MTAFNPALVRKYIETRVEPEIIQRAYQLCYLGCARIGEVISRKCPSDKTAHPTGKRLTWKTDVYRVNMQSKPEYESALFALLTNNRKMPSIEEILAIDEPVVIFTLETEKRKGGWTRDIALPLNPKYEPWAQPLLEFAEKHKGEELFPFYRQQLYPIAKKAFDGLTMEIKPYQRAVIDPVTKGYVYITDATGKKSIQTYTVKAHTRTFTQHDLRKTRRTELEDLFGLNSEERKRIGGWSRGIEERYDASTSEWRKSFPKLLRSVV